MSSERDAQLLAVGKQCSHLSCLLVDFLPFKCQHCEDAFCQEHFMVSAHNCPKYDESKHNRVAPNCPLCNTPVAVRPNQDPNERMEKHFNEECSVITGKTGKARSMPVCARGNCKKVLFSPIRCDSCKDQFCPAHRFPADHNCSPVPSPNVKLGSASNFLNNVNTKALNMKASAAGTAAVSAVKKTLATSNPLPTAPQKPAPVIQAQSSKSSTTPTSINPFSKTDRRAKAERESRRKAMQARAKKGLLSEEEKAILAAEEKEAEKKGDCVIM